jgi:hypothetical protein
MKVHALEAMACRPMPLRFKGGVVAGDDGNTQATIGREARGARESKGKGPRGEGYIEPRVQQDGCLGRLALIPSLPQLTMAS